MNIQSNYLSFLEDQRELPVGRKCQTIKNDKTQIYAARCVSFYFKKLMKINQNTMKSYIKMKRKNCSHVVYKMCIEYNTWNIVALPESS